MMTDRRDNGTAEVQLLTAEVRTLMVGSRQVTLSVYNQLDHVDPDRIEPFGRVHPNKSIRSGIDVVGRDCENGVLVRGWMSAPPPKPIAARVFAAWKFGWQLGNSDDWERSASQSSLARNFEYVAPDGVVLRLCEQGQSSGITLVIPDEDAQRVLADWPTATSRWAQWSALPLIVLAGLR